MSHWCTFYKHSVVFTPVHIQVNCITVDALLLLGEPNADLLFCTNHFFCKFTVHCTKSCTLPGHKVLFCKGFINNPHLECQWFLCSSCWLKLLWWQLSWLVFTWPHEESWCEKHNYNLRSMTWEALDKENDEWEPSPLLIPSPFALWNIEIDNVAVIPDSTCSTCRCCLVAWVHLWLLHPQPI